MNCSVCEGVCVELQFGTAVRQSRPFTRDDFHTS